MAPETIQEIPVRVDPAFASMKEVATYLNVSLRMAYKLTEKGIVPCRKFGAAVRVPWEWLREQPKVEPPAVEVAL